MKCFCGRPALDSGLCPYHDPQCIRDKKCRARLSFDPVCEGCNLPGGEASGVAPRLRGAKIHGPLIVETVVGDVDLSEARGVDVYIYNVRGAVRLGGSRFRHIYIDTVLGDVYMAGVKAESVVVEGVVGRVVADGAKLGGHLYVGEVKGGVSLAAAQLAGEAVLYKIAGRISAGARAYSIAISNSKGDVELPGANTEGDIHIVESTGERLDLTGVEVGGRIFLIASKFGGARIDRGDILKKLVML
ncbi:hypothetical protein Pogu_1191 [Pyrobaculum oguniense TE7]|uniref:Uncharacterized protein n=1 Tax=Pyrobaculum oguniense (strain DSM 13380 / JCM 10595 / TE7) TaxID=698757 RepID=H6Q8R3_PYROT|nr:hypothetical protein Pogu_1191 [Pyrobaculum oguniense TE7]